MDVALWMDGRDGQTDLRMTASQYKGKYLSGES